MGPESGKRNLTVVSAVFITFVLVVFLYLPLISTNNKKAKELNGLQEDLSLSLANLKAVRQDPGEKIIIKEGGASAFIDAITREGKALDVDFKSITQKDVRPVEDGYMLLPVLMEISARFENIGRFIAFLENSSAGFAVMDSFQIVRDERAMPKLSAILQVNIYLQKGLGNE